MEVTLVERKLGRHKADGFFNPNNNEIEIHPNLPPKRELVVTIHEFNHYLHPDWDEDKVIKFSNKMANFLWKHNFRKVKNK